MITKETGISLGLVLAVVAVGAGCLWQVSDMKEKSTTAIALNTTAVAEQGAVMAGMAATLERIERALDDDTRRLNEHLADPHIHLPAINELRGELRAMDARLSALERGG